MLNVSGCTFCTFTLNNWFAHPPPSNKFLDWLLPFEQPTPLKRFLAVTTAQEVHLSLRLFVRTFVRSYVTYFDFLTRRWLRGPRVF